MITEYIFSGAITTIIIGSLIMVNKELVRRPTFEDVDKIAPKKEVCIEVHKSVNEKLECIPDIKKSVIQIETKIDILLNNNGYPT